MKRIRYLYNLVVLGLYLFSVGTIFNQSFVDSISPAESYISSEISASSLSDWPPWW